MSRSLAPSRTSSYLLACTAVPDAGRMAFDGILAAEGAGVFCMLRDFDLLHLLAEGRTVAVQEMSVDITRASRHSTAFAWESQVSIIPCAVFAGDSDLLRSLRHCCGVVWMAMTVA